MQQEIKTIRLLLPYKLGSVNCYLIKNEGGFFLIDTGFSNNRAELEKEFAKAGCVPGNLKLVIITHGDFDHTGNAAYLRGKFAAQIAMHFDDFGMAERGDMFWNRGKGNSILRMLAPMLFGFKKSDRFTPDITLEDGYNLSGYGFDAKVLSLPGHSKGSIGIVTSGSDPSLGSGQALFCGDLLGNIDKPALNSIMDDLTVAKASAKKLMSLEIDTVYPGHGTPFLMEQLINEYQQPEIVS